ncbi:alpha/beta hydrolase [soil metagenome]
MGENQVQLRMVATSAVVFLLLAAALVVLLWWSQERIVFQPPAPGQRAYHVEGRVDYTADDGQRLWGFVVGEPRSAAGLLISFHGNGDLAVNQLPWAHEVNERTGWAVLLAEYRGYGGIDGRPTADGVRLDARAAYAAAVAALGADPRRIALHGHSLGTAIATELAADPTAAPVYALLLESPFTSVRDMARRTAGYAALLLRGRLMRFQWDTEAAVRELPVSIAVAHGARDGVVPVRMGRRVHAAAAVPGPLLIVEEAGHNDVAWNGGEEYWHWLARSLPEPPVRSLP